MSAPNDEMLSIREFARRDGCNEKLVRRAISDGHLRPSPDGKLTADLVGTGWRKTNRRGADTADIPADILADTADIESLLEDGRADDFIRQVLSGNFAEMAEAERIKENGLALKHLLDARRKAGALIDLGAAQDAFFRVSRDNRDAWMGWVPRIAVSAAAELRIDERQLAEVLTRYVHQHLTELGEPEFEPDSDPAEG